MKADGPKKNKKGETQKRGATGGRKLNEVEIMGVLGTGEKWGSRLLGCEANK